MKSMLVVLFGLLLTTPCALATDADALVELATRALEFNAQASQEFSGQINEVVLKELKSEALASKLGLGDYVANDLALKKTLADLTNALATTRAKSPERFVALSKAFIRYKTHISGDFPSLNYTLRIRLHKLIVDDLKNYL